MQGRLAWLYNCRQKLNIFCSRKLRVNIVTTFHYISFKCFNYLFACFQINFKHMSVLQSELFLILSQNVSQLIDWHDSDQFIYYMMELLSIYYFVLDITLHKQWMELLTHKIYNDILNPKPFFIYKNDWFFYMSITELNAVIYKVSYITHSLD